MKTLYKNLPEMPGVYLFKDAAGKILYIGKAVNLKRRVSSYFERPHDARIQKLVSEIKKIGYKKTDSALEALILEAALIKKYEPPFNIREKDDKSFLYVEITKEKFPRILLVRGKSEARGSRFGPFTSASSIREALRIIRKIFPWSTHTNLPTPNQRIATNTETERIRRNLKHSEIKFVGRPCFDYQIGLCPGTCIGAIPRPDYLKNIRSVNLLFKGKKGELLQKLEKEMRSASERMDFEKAGKIKKQMFALQHVQDVALIGEDSRSDLPSSHNRYRIEGYDISNISGASAVGAMVVFRGTRPDRNEYRKFKIQTLESKNPARAAGGDVGMLREVLERRFSRRDWPLPDLVLIDGGEGQVNAAKEVLKEKGFDIPVVGIAKGPTRKKNEFIGKIPKGVEETTLIRMRNEAHRFAIQYHKGLRSRNFISRV